MNSRESSAAERLAETALAFLAAWERGDGETSATDEADDLRDALWEWHRAVVTASN